MGKLGISHIIRRTSGLVISLASIFDMDINKYTGKSYTKAMSRKCLYLTWTQVLIGTSSRTLTVVNSVAASPPYPLSRTTIVPLVPLSWMVSLLANTELLQKYQMLCAFLKNTLEILCGDIPKLRA